MSEQAEKDQGILARYVDSDAERGVIGSIAWDPERVHDAQSWIDESDIYDPHLRCLFMGFAKASGSRARLSSAEWEQAIAAACAQQGAEQLFKSRGEARALVHTCWSALTSAAYLRHYCQRVGAAALMRRHVKVIHEAKLSADKVQLTPESVSGFASEVAGKLLTTEDDRTARRIDSVQMAEEFAEAVVSGEDWVPKTPTGSAALDDLLNGGMPRDGLVVAAARPGVGKTALAVTLCVNALQSDTERGALFVSLEMDPREIMRRTAACAGRVDAEQLFAKHQDPEVTSRVADGVEFLRSVAPRYFVTRRPGMTIGQLRSEALRAKARSGALGMVVVDYLQLVRDPETLRLTRSREQEVASVTRNLKELATELECPVFTLAQLNRDLEKRSDKAPQTSDLRESGAIEQDADAVLMMHRPGQYDSAKDLGLVEVYLRKYRHGPVGQRNLHLHGAQYRFAERAIMEEAFPVQTPEPARRAPVDFSQPRGGQR